MERRGLLVHGPRPAQQLWRMYEPSMLAVLPFVPELSVLLLTTVGSGMRHFPICVRHNGGAIAQTPSRPGRRPRSRRADSDAAKLLLALLSIAGAAAMLYRYLKFFRHYTMEVLISYPETKKAKSKPTE
jgi:hypothetical protein